MLAGKKSNRITLSLIALFLCAGIGGLGGPVKLLPAQEEERLSVFRGISHVHTRFSHDSNARLTFLIEQGMEKDLDFIVVTDHNSLRGARFYQRMQAPPRPLLIFGNEISAPEGHLIALGVSKEPRDHMSSQELIDWIREEGGYSILAHPFSQRNPWRNWELKGWDGIEIFSFGHSLFGEGGGDFISEALFGDPVEALPTVQGVPDEDFAFWDDLLRERPVTALAGTDAHLKRRPATFIAALKSVTMYVLAPELKEREIIEAIGTGRTFMVFESRGKASGFSFWAESQGRRINLGEKAALEGGVSLRARIPSPATIRLIRHGEVVAERDGSDLSFSPESPGAYRVEVYRDGDLWIFSNPIYLRS